MRPWVYVASPYTKGDACINTKFQCDVWDQLMTDGKVWPYVPLWTHFQHQLHPRPYQDWIDYDLRALEDFGFDACLRLNAQCYKLDYYVSESSGADDEVAKFREMGRPVFCSIPDLYEWVEDLEIGDRVIL